MTAPMIRANPTRPPATPPAIAAVFVPFFSPPGAAVGKLVGVCTIVVSPPGPLTVIILGASILVVVMSSVVLGASVLFVGSSLYQGRLADMQACVYRGDVEVQGKWPDHT
jgi:hypothetical protein